MIDIPTVFFFFHSKAFDTHLNMMLSEVEEVSYTEESDATGGVVSSKVKNMLKHLL